MTIKESAVFMSARNQVERAIKRAADEQPKLETIVNILLKPSGEQEDFNDDLIDLLSPHEQAVVYAMAGLLEIKEFSSEKREGAEAGLRVGLCLLEELTYRTNSATAGAQQAAALANEVGLHATELFKELVSAHHFTGLLRSQTAAEAGRKKRGHSGALRQSLEFLLNRREEGASLRQIIEDINHLAQYEAPIEIDPASPSASDILYEDYHDSSFGLVTFVRVEATE